MGHTGPQISFFFFFKSFLRLLKALSPPAAVTGNVQNICKAMHTAPKLLLQLHLMNCIQETKQVSWGKWQHIMCSGVLLQTGVLTLLFKLRYKSSAAHLVEMVRWVGVGCGETRLLPDLLSSPVGGAGTTELV